jgi:hypothetical protein
LIYYGGINENAGSVTDFFGMTKGCLELADAEPQTGSGRHHGRAIWDMPEGRAWPLLTSL